MAKSESEDRGSDILQSREMWENFWRALAGAAVAAAVALAMMATFLL